jgi:hypothetical protein
MAYEVSWLIEGRVVYIRHYDSYTTEDLQRVSQEVMESYCAKRTGDLLHFVVDVQESIAYQIGLSSIKRIQIEKKDRHFGVVVILTKGTGRLDEVFDLVVSALSQAFKFRVRRVKSLEGVVETLRQIDPEFDLYISKHPEAIREAVQ